MSKPFWKFQNVAGGRAELLLYGDISDSTWWGDEVTPKQFAEDLDKLGAVSEITVRINSGGGDVFAAQTIGNLLEQHPANVVARIDGLCASSATIVACHCDRVVAANDSTYMVHPVRLGLLGYYDATTMQQYLNALDTIKENIISLYAKKTGRDKEEVTGWMELVDRPGGQGQRLCGRACGGCGNAGGGKPRRRFVREQREYAPAFRQGTNLHAEQFGSTHRRRTFCK